jgi:O-palmitoleoyl-L-serine hydrolase
MGRSEMILLAILCLCALATEQPYKKIIHNSDPNAKCLDGTSPALYLHEGGDTSKFLVFFVGGGYCAGTTLNQVLEECYKRSKGDSGSSKDLPDSFLSPGGYLSTDATESRFATWTKVVIFYCDGAHHQGYNKDAISYKDATLYFRGEANTKSHFKWISTQYDFAGAEKVLLTGASSGGIATFSYSNYVRSLLKNPEVLYTVADSGAFINASNVYTGVYDVSEQAKTLFQISNADAKSPIQICNDKYKGEEYKCLFLQYSFTSIQGRLMLINSEYD